MMKHNLNLDIAEAGWLQALTSAETISAEVFTHVLDYISAHETIDFLQTGKPVSVNLCLSNDSEVHQRMSYLSRILMTTILMKTAS